MIVLKMHLSITVHHFILWSYRFFPYTLLTILFPRLSSNSHKFLGIFLVMPDMSTYETHKPKITLAHYPLQWITSFSRGHSDTLITHLPPTCEVGGSNPEPHVGKMVVMGILWSNVMPVSI